MKPLSATELEDFLGHNPDWKLADGALVREWLFKDFLGSMEFVNRVATVAEEAGHHPDIEIRYNRVRLKLTTHDANGITAHDASMAAQLSRQFPSFQSSN